MLVDFGKPGWKVVHDMIDRVRERHIYQGTIRKDSRDFATETFVESVVVVDVEEAATGQEFPQTEYFGVRELDDSVAGDVKKRVVPKPVIPEADACFRRFDLQARSFVYCLQQIREAGWVRVPVPAAVIL
jgi:hypothetical protein